MNPPPFSEPDWSRLERDWAAWWNHELQRPMLIAVSTRHTDRVRPDWWTGGLGQIPHSVPAVDIAAEAWDDISRTTHDGDSWPRFWMNYGPGIGAGFLGGVVEPAPNTVWFLPGIWKDKPLDEIRPFYNRENLWWRRVQDVTRACIEQFAGRAQVGFTDIGGNLDIAASLRDTMNLLLDCADDPDAVGELCQDGSPPLWLRYYDGNCPHRARRPRHERMGPALESRPDLHAASDFSYMISPGQFEQWVAPDVAACCARLDHGFYHLDGKGQIPHLDHLLAIPDLCGIQWIPGDGQPESADPVWWPLLKRIRDAGKLVQSTVPARPSFAWPARSR